MYVSLLFVVGAPLHKVTLTYWKRFSKQGLVKKGRLSASPLISSCFNLLGYVILMLFVSGSHSTSQPRDSATNLKGTMVLLFVISGTTLGLDGSIITSWP